MSGKFISHAEQLVKFSLNFFWGFSRKKSLRICTFGLYFLAILLSLTLKSYRFICFELQLCEAVGEWGILGSVFSFLLRGHGGIT
jgi:hypothetical protein